MRVAHVLASVDDPDAGPSYSVPALCREISALGAKVEIHTVQGWRAFGQGPADVQVSRHPQDLANAPLAGRMCLSSALKDALAAEAGAGAILHAHGLWLAPNLYPARVIRGTTAKLVVSPRGMLGQAALGFSSARKRLLWTFNQRRAVSAAHCLHATAESELEEIRSAGLTNPVAVIPNGVDIPASIRRLPGEERVVLSLGRIHPKKGLPDLLRAWAKVDRTGWWLRIVGPDEGGHAAELKALAAELGLADVAIEGALHGPAKADALCRASLFVLPSLNENFAMTVAEALAAGVPVLATKGAPWAGLEGRSCGWWVEGGADALAAGLVAAMALSSSTLAQMGARGRAWMQAEFSWSQRAAEMMEVYRWLNDGALRPTIVRMA